MYLFLFLFFCLRLAAAPLTKVALDPPAKELDKELSSFVGKEINKETIFQIKEKIRKYYQKQGRPFVEVKIPSQKIEDGVLLFCISEKVLGEISAADDLLPHLHVEQNAPINIKELSKDVDWINQSPFRKVSAVLSPSDDKINLSFHIDEKRPIKAYSGFSEDSFVGGLALGLAHGQIFSYQGGYCPFNNNSFSHSFQYEVPLPKRSNLKLSGGYSQKHSFVDAKTFSLGVCYKISQISIGGYGKKMLLHFLSEEAAYLMKFVLGYESHLSKNCLFSAELHYLPPSIHSQEVLLYASQNNLLAKISIEGNIALPFGLLWKTRCFAQGAFNRLPISEQLSLGGVATIRGYKERIYGSDQGVIVNSELILSKRSAEILCFFDYGYAGGSLASVGCGLRYLIDPYLNLKLELGVPIFERRGAGFHFSALFSY